MADVTTGDIEGVREDLLDRLPDDVDEHYRTGYIDAVIAFDRRLTEPAHLPKDAPEYPYGQTD